jgi:uncharacterized protein
MDTTAAVAGPAAGLFGKSRRAVLGLLFGHPDERFYLRQISRLTNVGLGALQRELAILEAAGILISTRLARSVFFQANRDCAIFSELLGLVTKTMGAAASLSIELKQLGDRIKVAFIFGSLAESAHDARSDIDMFVIGDVRTRDVIAQVDTLQLSLRREINPVVMSPAEFRKRCAGKNSFVSDVLRSPRIYLIGDEHELGELAGGRLVEATQRKPGAN